MIYTIFCFPRGFRPVQDRRVPSAAAGCACRQKETCCPRASHQASGQEPCCSKRNTDAVGQRSFPRERSDEFLRGRTGVPDTARSSLVEGSLSVCPPMGSLRPHRRLFDQSAVKRLSTLRVICSVNSSRRVRPMTHSQLPAVTTSPAPRAMATSIPEPYCIFRRLVA